MSHTRVTTVQVLVPALHVVAALGLLLVRGNGVEILGETILVLVLGVPLSQCSLMAIWGATSREKAFVRFVLATLVVASAWFVLLNLLDRAYEPDMSATWASMFLTQAVLVVFGAAAGRLYRRQLRRRRLGNDDGPWQYGLGSLLLWVTLAAVTLSSWQVALRVFGWTPEVLKAEYFFFGPILGAYNAAYALLALGSFTGPARLRFRLPLGLVLIGLLAATQTYLLEALFSNDGGMTLPMCLMLAGGQAVCLYATLLPLRLCGYLAGDGSNS